MHHVNSFALVIFDITPLEEQDYFSGLNQRKQQKIQFRAALSYGPNQKLI